MHPHPCTLTLHPHPCTLTHAPSPVHPHPCTLTHAPSALTLHPRTISPVPSPHPCALSPGRVSSKWLDFGGGGQGGTAWLEYRRPPGTTTRAPLLLTHYDMVAAEDCPERDPRDWVIEGVTEEDEAAGT